MLELLGTVFEALGAGVRAAREAYSRRRKEQASLLIPEADSVAARIEKLTAPPSTIEKATPREPTDPDTSGS